MGRMIMDSNQELRHLTREEQLLWLIPFLEQQIQNYTEDLQNAKNELQLIQKKEKKRILAKED